MIPQNVAGFMYSTTGNIIFEINAELKSTINSPFYNLHKIAKKVDFGNEKVPFPSFSTKILLLSLTQFFSGQKKRVKGKPWYRRSILGLKPGNGTFSFPKSTF